MQLLINFLYRNSSPNETSLYLLYLFSSCGLIDRGEEFSHIHTNNYKFIIILYRVLQSITSITKMICDALSHLIRTGCLKKSCAMSFIPVDEIDHMVKLDSFPKLTLVSPNYCLIKTQHFLTEFPPILCYSFSSVQFADLDYQFILSRNGNSMNKLQFLLRIGFFVICSQSYYNSKIQELIKKNLLKNL